MAVFEITQFNPNASREPFQCRLFQGRKDSRKKEFKEEGFKGGFKGVKTIPHF
jgi:hypothetical protein